MLLATHVLIGTSLARLVPQSPLAAFAIGLASHYASDMIPHWNPDYNAVMSSPDDGRKRRLLPGGKTIAYIALGAGEFASGIALAWWFYGTSGLLSQPVFWAAALGSSLPDLMQFAYVVWKNPAFAAIQRWHDLWHAPKGKDIHDPARGMLWQVLLSAAFVAVATFLL